MITGITQADCALLVINAIPGKFEESMAEIDGMTRAHLFYAFTFGIR